MLQVSPLHASVLDKLDQQYETFYNKYMASKPLIHQIPWDPAVRSSPAVPGGAALLPVGKTKDLSVDQYRLRVFYPPSYDSTEPPQPRLPIFIWYHGGGMVLGGIDAENGFCTRVCVSVGVIVVTVDYRLAPEWVYPCGSDDAWEAFKWILANGERELGADVSTLAIGGSSSGGNLALMVAQKAALEHIPIKLVMVTVPVCDNLASDQTYESWNVNRHCPGLPEDKMLWYRENYLPNPSDRSDWKASPLLAPDSNFAALASRHWIGLAELDLLRSEGEAYAARLEEAGKDVTVKIYPGVPHAVQAMDGVLDVGREMIKDACVEICKSLLGDDGSRVKMETLYPRRTGD